MEWQERRRPRHAGHEGPLALAREQEDSRLRHEGCEYEDGPPESRLGCPLQGPLPRERLPEEGSRE
eukprot:7104497-Alexandrium_andersonii.AAC.1